MYAIRSYYAFNAVSRQAIMTDPDFHDGNYAEHGVAPHRPPFFL